MPQFRFQGVGFGSGGVSDTDLVLKTASGVTSFSYRYINNGDGDAVIDANISGGFTIKIGGERANLNKLNVSLGELEWGAGYTTTFVLAATNRSGFISATDGDAIPELAADNGHVLLEFFELANEDTSDGRITSGPFRPGQSIDLADLASDDTTGRVMQGNQKDNTLKGTAKDDLIVGQKGNDVVVGKGGADTLMLGRGNDKANGGGGADVLSGYLGNDKLTGGAGADRFIFSDGGDRDTITDFRKGNDRLVLDEFLWFDDLNARQVVREFASREDGTITMDFGQGNVLTLKGFGNLNKLDDYIDIV